MKYAATPAGVSELNSTNNKVGSAVQSIEESLDRIRPVLDGYSQELGAHYDEIEEAITNINQQIAGSTESATNVQHYLCKIIEKYETIIAHKHNYSNGNVRYVDADDTGSQKSIGAKTLRR